ncbi:cytochrome P450 [Streptomyces sp. NBC_00820]|uniref:cytochrome P450 n=1 Tax=Streptomyces sp. NBC_00820 TaxID=2975842 RepID=UPI002ED55A68|nr:cytochrome P450 [Streptomyces sp. NBC_00820]
MTAVPPLLEAGPGGVEEDLASAHALVSAFDSDQGGPGGGDPHREFAALRRTGAVHRSTLERIFTGADLSGTTGTPVWHVVSFAAADRVLRDEHTFSSSAYADSMGQVVGRSFLEIDGGEHRAWRNVLNRGFHRQAVASWQARLRADALSRLTAMADRGGGDLVGEVAFPVALTTIAGIIGFPLGTRIGTLYTWAVGLLDDTDGKIATAVAEWLGTPSTWPADSVVGRLLRCDDPAIGTGSALLPAVRLLLSTGTEPPYRALATLMYAVLHDPAVLEAVRVDVSISPALVQECWRWECPLTWVLRRCTTDTELCGVRLRAGDSVCVNLASANRDGSRWPDADRFNPHRRPLPHLAVGSGPHLCLGRHLAALEAEEILGGLLQVTAGRPSGPVLDTDGVSGRGFRSPLRLTLRF